MSKSRWPDPEIPSGEPALPPGAQGPLEPPGDPAPGAAQLLTRLTRGRLPWILAFVCAVLVGATISAAVVELPYFALRPGSVHDTGEVITVEGEETFLSNGTINYTTVSIQPVTTFGLISGWLDDDVDIESRRDVLGDRNAEENRELNRFYMDRSQHDAMLVALETLGYDVEVHISGELVHKVEDGLPADGVLDSGDVITEIDGEPLDELDEVQSILASRDVGDRIDLLVLPDEGQGEPEERTLTLAESPEGDRAIMGVNILPFEVEYDFPFEIGFDTGEVGGPSAGLAFTLSLLDLLTEGDLTGGLDVAVTGAIGPDGEILPVGGTAQKAAAARRADMDLFLVPASETDTDKTRARSGDVEVLEVATLQDALDALAERGGDPLDVPAPEEGEDAA